MATEASDDSLPVLAEQQNTSEEERLPNVNVHECLAASQLRLLQWDGAAAAALPGCVATATVHPHYY